MRIGRLIYLNSAPFYYGLDRGLVKAPEMQIIPGVPAELNQMMAQGDLDISVISAIVYARYHHELVLLPDLCVSANGPVMSVLLISKVDPSQLDGKKVALTTSSATAQALVKVLLHEMYKVSVEYITLPPNRDAMLEAADACLIIGDDALLLEPDPTLKVYDLGQLWKTFTGLPMVFAVVAARREFASRYPDKLAKLSIAMHQSVHLALNSVDDFSNEDRFRRVSQRISLKNYFRHLSFSFDEQKQKGLLSYYEKAARLSLCPECRSLEFCG